MSESSSSRVRHRVSAGTRKVVTFVAKRVGVAHHDLRSGVHSLLHSSPPRFRKWFPVSLAAFMTVLTCLVSWSIASRLPTVLADTSALGRQIEVLEQQIYGTSDSPEDRDASERAIASIHKQQDKAEQERVRLNDRIAKLQSELEEKEKRGQDIRRQEEAERKVMEEHKEKFKAVFGRDLEVQPGPPLHYDPGPTPKPPPQWLPHWLWPPSEYYKQLAAWEGAKQACNAFNAFQDQTGVDLVQLQRTMASVEGQIKDFSGTLEEVGKRVSSLGRELKGYTDAPVTAWEDLNTLRKQLAKTSLVQNVFWFLDIPTLLSCVATTAVAYSRMFLISGRFGPRQLVKV